MLPNTLECKMWGIFFIVLKKRVTTFTYTSRTLGRQQTTDDVQQEERLSQRIKGIFSHKLEFFFSSPWS